MTNPLFPWPLVCTRSMIEAPPSYWHGIAGYDPQRNRIRYAVVPLNCLLYFALWLWFLLLHPERFLRLLWLDKDYERLRRVERELRCVTRACHEHRLLWTGERFLTYEQAEAEAKAQRENPPRTIGPAPPSPARDVATAIIEASHGR
jgi:hypothetical protein